VLATLTVGVIINLQLPSPALLVSTCVILIGALVTGWHSLDHDYAGIAFVWLNNFT
jgi:hypothetical protein